MRISTFFHKVLKTFSFVLIFAYSSFLQSSTETKKIISDVIIEGNSLIKTDAIYQRLLYKKGDVFDADLSASAINKLYSLGYFSQIKIEKEEAAYSVVLYVVLKEKQSFDGYEIIGNNHISTKKIIEKLKLKSIPTIDENDISYFCSQIRKMYREDNYHKTTITGILKPSESSAGVELVLTIDEGPASKVRQIEFVGIKQIPEWRLRSALMTKELWLLGYADGSGRFNPEMIEADKQNIEFAYQNLGFVRAHVVDFKVESPKDDESAIKLTFYIDEGEQYRVRYVMLPYDEEISKQEFLDVLTIKEGALYSRAAALSTVEGIRAILGKHGYSDADVHPIPKVDEETKTIDFTFSIDKGEKVHVRSINITGNKLTHDIVIRREISLDEGSLITSPELNVSKRRIEALGFFERGGVVWKTHKLSDGLVDLELAVVESKTGSFNLVGGLGGRQGRMGSGLQIGINLAKRNLFGRGWSSALNLQVEGASLGTFGLNFYNPYIFNTNIECGFDTYYRVEEYGQWRASESRPRERVVGGVVNLGFRIPKIDRDLRCQCEFGIENNLLLNNKAFEEERQTFIAAGNYSLFIMDRAQKTGTLCWLGSSIIKDTRNHPVYPTRGGRLTAKSKLGLPGLKGNFGFIKLEIDGSWYMPLIGEETLVFTIHGRTGIIESTSNTSYIPYRELYHMGGQDSIRGFVGGGAGPILVGSGALSERNMTPIGARKHAVLNVELQTPMLESYGMRGRLFYDAGCGWNSVMNDIPAEALPYVKRNDFNIRHAVGFGFSVTKPQMIKIDWGYKLDRDKKFNESDWEVHMSMNVPW